jgi:NAD(P)-dependent dehydrogenase (short-subunit alcohol dehydrogenase family)
MAGWTIADMPDLAGRRALVTGATNGIGLETAQALARAGATVLISGRDPARGAAALEKMRARRPEAEPRFIRADLARLAEVRALAAEVGEAPLDLLVNNAGVMAIPTRRLSADGFEMQFAVNHLAHFALTGWLLPALRAAPAPIIVTVSSLAHRRAVLRLDDLQGEREYAPWTAYRQSKLANLMFARELHRRSEALGWAVGSRAAHPGWASTGIVLAGPRLDGDWLRTQFIALSFGLVAQSAARGALPTLFAATAREARNGVYYGPDRWGETRGAPAPAVVMPQAQDVAAAVALWEASERLTGVAYPSGP